MEPTLPTPSPSMLAQPHDNASGQPQPSSPRSSSSNDKADESFSLSSDAGDQSLRHPKGKRKRTAAKDKAILEAAYLANPKPDKTARLDIVSKVSLNEKEVQIWFQNRRQNDRRKSRPLSAAEIAALRYGGMHALSSDPPPPFGHASLSQHASFSSDGSASSPPHHPHFTSSALMNPVLPSTTPASSPELGPWMPDAMARRSLGERRTSAPDMARELRDRDANADRAPAAGAHTPGAASSFSSSVGSVGYLANRWNLYSSSFSTPSSLGGEAGSPAGEAPSAKAELFGHAASSTPVLPPPQARQQQQQQQPKQQPTQQGHQRLFRLSLSLDGKAEVIPSQSPSPPRRLPLPHPTVPLERRSGGSSTATITTSGGDSLLPALPAIRRAGLSRSHSALPHLTSLTLPPISSLTNSLASGSAPPVLPQPSHHPHPPRLLRGRSRDVHAWESVCDAETRVDDELSAHAETEASGSAIAAISLLRSTSSTSANSASPSALQANGSKRNAVSRLGAPRLGMKRAKLGRALSSVARMQNVSRVRDVRHEGEKDKVWVDEEKKKKLKLSTLLSGNDSDKENWSPDEEGRHGSSGSHGRRPLPASRNSQQPRPVFGGERKGGKGLQFASRAAGGKGGGGSFDGLEIYEDTAAGGSNGSTPKPGQLARAATVPATLPAADEVENFMRGGHVSPSKKGDLDCVAGLLSLSQGNWR